MFYKVFGWFMAVLGMLAVFGSVGEEESLAGVVGGLLFLSSGAVVLKMDSERLVK